MMLLIVGCSYRTAPVEVRERLAFGQDRLLPALDQLVAHCHCEAIILSTCNRIELYLARDDGGEGPDSVAINQYLSGFHRVAIRDFSSCLYEHRQADAINHLFRVVASLDSMIVGETQIAGQVKHAYEVARERGTAGPALHALFQRALLVAKRVRTETDISKGHVSVSSAAVEYVRQVFDHFHDKTVLVIGAGKMGELTLRHLHGLRPQQIWVVNRNTAKAADVAAACGGRVSPWEQLDERLAQADIVLSTTGAAEPIVSLERYERIRRRRRGGPVVILDIAVPRDFDPRIHDGETTCLFNIDDLHRIREQTLAERQKQVAPAEVIVTNEVRRFLKEWTRRHHGPIIARLTADFETKREAIVQQLLSRLNGRLTEDDRLYVEGAFRLLQNQFLHGPISALADEPHDAPSHTLLEAIRKLFRLHD
jgi:glutamyl-tRNA reductase